MKKRTMKQLTILSMIFLILLPTLTRLLGIGNFYSINENRYKKQLPAESILQGFTGDGSYWKKLEEVFNDNFGFRDLFIRTKNQILYTVFDYSKELYIGKDNYMSYFNDVALEQINNERISPERFTEIMEAYHRVEAFCEEKGLELFYLVAPQKNTVFPETSVGFPVRRPPFTMYDKFIEYCNSSSLRDKTLNVKEVLREAEKTQPTFYYQDFHWNDWGAAVTFGLAVNQVAKRIGLPECYDIKKLNFSTFEMPRFYGVQIDSLSVLLPPTFDPAITVSMPITSVAVQEEEAYPYLAHFINKEPKLEGKALFIGDSYTTPAVSTINETNPGIVDCFPEVRSIHYNNAKGLLRNLPEGTKYVFIEFIESVFSYSDMYLNSLLEE